jgi:glyoxylase-like metal-dependent hydrolase (beta-lactamase superfamily II)
MTFGIAYGSSVAAQDPSPMLEISNVRGDLYLVRAGEQATVFLVTPDGIILADTLNAVVARSLRVTLETQFPGRSVRYIVHTHHHFDRADGASVFVDTAVLAGHRAFNDALDGSRRSLQSDLASRDRNRNGVLERDELGSDALATLVLARDRNRDGRVTRNEMYETVQRVQKVYESGQEITLGGRTVVPVYTGASHSVDMIALYFPSERVVFAADPPPVTTVPFSFGTSPPGDVVRWVREISSLDFDILVSGDGGTMPKSEVVAIRQYLDDLVAGVTATRHHALPIRELRGKPPLIQYTGVRYGLMDQNIAQAYRSTQTRSVEIYGAAVTSYQPRNDYYCDPERHSQGSCTLPPGNIQSGVLGVRITNGRFGAAAEMRAPVRSAFVLGSNAETTVVHRETLSSYLFRATAVAKRRYSLAALGGITIAIGHTRATVREGQEIRFFSDDNSLFGWTAGVEGGLSVRGRASIEMHVRTTRLRGRDFLDVSWGNSDTSIGVGLAVRMFHRTSIR